LEDHAVERALYVENLAALRDRSGRLLLRTGWLGDSLAVTELSLSIF